MSEIVLDSPAVVEAMDSPFRQSLEMLPQLAVSDSAAAYASIEAMRENHALFATSLHTEEMATPVVDTLLTAMRSTQTELANRDYFLLGKDHGKRAQHNLSGLIVQDLGTELMDCAEAHEGTELDFRIASLLFESYTSAANGVMSPRQRSFLTARLPAVMQSLSARIQKGRKTDDPLPSRMNYLDNNETKLLFATGDILTQIVRSASADDKPLKQSFTQLMQIADTDAFAKLMMQTFIDKWHVQTALGNLLGMQNSNLENALREGFGPSEKNPLSVPEYRLLAFQRMFALEGKRPGICRTLYRENRFRNFGRHSEEFFLDIYDRRGDQGSYDKLVYMLFASTDGNGSVLRNSGPKLEALRKELLAKKIGVVAAEYMDDHDLKILTRQAKLAKLSRACIVISDSHGDEDSIGSNLYGITQKTVQEWLGAAVAELTTEDAEIYLMACSTARYSNGFAAALHRATGKRTVFGSRGGSYVRRIGFSIDKQAQPRLVIDSRRKGDTPGRKPLRVFKKGRSLILDLQQVGSPLKRSVDKAVRELLKNDDNL